MKTELLSRIEYLGERLPPNTLDQLIDELGGPENVAEVCEINFLFKKVCFFKGAKMKLQMQGPILSFLYFKQL